MFSNEDKNITLYGFDENNSAFTGVFDYFWAKGTGYAANSTDIAPPETDYGYVAIFDKNSNTWSEIEDHRGKTVYSIEDKTGVKVEYVGSIRNGYTELKPDHFDTWNGTAWEDQRTPDEVENYNRSLLPKLSKRQFSLYLYDHQMYDQVMQAIEANLRFKIEYDAVSDIERLSPTVSEMTALLGWTDEQVDQMWEHALTL